MSESEPLLNQNVEIQEEMISLRAAAMNRRVNAYVDDLATSREAIDKQMDQITKLLAVLSFLSIFFSVLIVEISWSYGSYEHDNFGLELCKLIVSGLTIFIFFALWKKYQILAFNVSPKPDRIIQAASGNSRFAYQSNKKKQVQPEGKSEPNIEEDEDPKYERWWHYQSVFTFSAEILFNSLHCAITMNSIHAPLALFRVYHFIGLLRWIPVIRELRMKQIQSGEQASQSNWSIIKTCLRFHPWLSIIGFICFFLPILSYSVYTVERVDEESSIDNYWTALWITAWMLFVGEAYSPTTAGRGPALLVGISSLIVSTLVFVGLQRTLEIDSQEEAITNGKLESLLQSNVKNAAAQWSLMAWYEKVKKDKNPDSPELSNLKQKLQEAKCKLDKVKQRRPTGAASVVVQIQDLVQDTAAIIDNFKLSALGKLTKMEKQWKKIKGANKSDDENKTVERLVQTYTDLQQNSEEEVKKIAEKIDSFSKETKRSIADAQSKNSNIPTDTLDSLKRTSLHMEEQFKSIIDKQTSQTKDLNQAKMEIEAWKEQQKQQIDICDRLRKEIKELAEMQKSIITSNLETHSQQLIDKFNSEIRSPNSNISQRSER